MLNVEKFYTSFGASHVTDTQHLEINEFRVLAHPDKVYLIDKRYNPDAFQWFSYPIDSIVFYTVERQLGLLVLFDKQVDETENAIQEINFLINAIH